MLISYPNLYPQFAVAVARFTGERGRVPTRGCDELGTAGEGDERRINYDFWGLERPNVIPACRIILGEFHIKVML